MSPRTLKVALLQERDRGSVNANLDAIEAGLREAAKASTQLVLLQEIHNGPYFCQHESVEEFDRAESIPGPSTDRIGKLAAKLKLVVVASLFERRAAGLYHNTAVVFDRSENIAGTYRKMHIPDDPAYYEKFYFTPGDLGFQSFATRAGAVGTIICWDQWFPEAARLTALAGAEIVCVPTAIGWHPAEKAEWGERQLDAWITAQRAHAIANGVFVAVPNRVGLERDAGLAGTPAGDGIEFWGNSFIAAPDGRVLARGGASEEEIVMAACDLDEVERT
ncbi:MAG: carbon-nitrogen hydrolase, partial [Xanthomonadaceae bacterium]|nr:carbon-nitrogen hydrolase [Xanthomonadaceae bacterium]